MIRKSIGQETKGCNRPWKIPLPKAILCSQWTMLLPPSCHCCKYIGHHAILLTQSLAKSCFVGRSWNTSFLYPHYKRCKSNFVVLYFYASSSASSTFLQRLLVKILSFVFVNEKWRKRRDRKTLSWPSIGPQKVVDWEVYCLYLNICLQIFKAWIVSWVSFMEDMTMCTNTAQ